MLSVALSQLRSDIASKMKGTSTRQVTDFYGVAAAAAGRMLSRIDTEETRRTATLAVPFMDNLQDYALASDYKRMIDIRPQANRIDQPGLSHFDQTAARQFNERLTPDSYSIRWNNMIRTLRAQRLPAGNVATMDTFDSITGNGTWAAGGEASGLEVNELNFVQGNGSLEFDLSVTGGAGYIENSTAAAVDLSDYQYQDMSIIAVYIPVGFSSRFTNFKLIRGSSASAYKEATVTTKLDGTAFTDGWNFLLFAWNTASTTGSPDDTLNTYRKFTCTYTAGTAITGVLVDNWTDSFGTLYETEYYSEYLFRTSAGVWIATPTAETDLVNVGPASYEIFKAEMMIDVTQIIRTGSVLATQLQDWRKMLNGEPATNRNVSPSAGLYSDYVRQFPSSAITTITKTYEFDL